jgi:hypothetical protein
MMKEKNLYYISLLFFFFTLSTLTTSAQTRVYSTSRIIKTPPVIDGVINDSAWSEVNWSGNFLQRQPYEGLPPSQKTEFKVLYDNSYLYIAIRLWDTQPNLIQRRLTRRDTWEGDWIGIGIDSYNDDLTAFVFAVSAAGVKNDAIVSNDSDFDDTWDPVWYTKVSIDDLGWYAEMKIPYNQLRFSDIQDHIWGFEVHRNLFRLQEESLWQLIPQDAGGYVSRWGSLVGINNIKPKKEIALTPYGMVNYESYEREENNPFATGSEFGFNVGLDGKVAITNELTLNFTVNPDFGQVEADPSEVNLSAFETFFQEKRPFFIEGSNIFDFKLTQGEGPFSEENLFYSRRIGAQPHYEPELLGSEYAKAPEFTRILGAVKLSGKTQNGLSVGILETITKEEKAIIDYNGERRDEVIEPITNFFNTRVQKDYNRGNTQIGGMLTATNRFINDSALNFLPNSAYTGGLDFANYWNEKSYFLTALATFSIVNGSTEAITALQESPQHYFQRPDSDHLNVDTTLTRLTGSGGTIEVGKIGGGHWTYSGRFMWRSPGLELNDMGYLRYADAINITAYAEYRIWEPIGILRSFNISSTTWRAWDYSGVRLHSGINLRIQMQLMNYFRVRTGMYREGYDIDRHELRGGPSLKVPGSWGTFISVTSDDRKRFVLEMFSRFQFGDDDYQQSNSFGMELAYRPFDFLELSFEPSYTFSESDVIYIDKFEEQDLNHSIVYLVSAIDKEFVNFDFRINVGITPNLSIQYWGQPFLFSGDYYDFKKVINASFTNWQDQYYTFNQIDIDFNDSYDTYTIHDGSNAYTLENPDFSFFEFRSNLVVRWEYLPGSTAYLVWSQGRTGDDPNGNFSLSDNISKLAQITPHNVIHLKLSYRFSY